MHKIKINGYFKNSNLNNIINYNCYGIKNNNEIEFKNDLDKINICIENHKILFKRENPDIIMNYEFILNKSTKNNVYRLKKENLEISFEINTIKLEITENKIFVIFNILEINNNFCNYKLSLNYKVV